eukprot:GAFH01003970.1.p3 GENE.GAFH01003970.1~~GAFH01003970.1.p3  ORF type:complete len:80 (+),score=4.43 GAFH01003970.1:29-268(+)
MHNKKMTTVCEWTRLEKLSTTGHGNRAGWLSTARTLRFDQLQQDSAIRVHNLPEYDMVPIQPGRGRKGDEELAAIAVGA